LDIPIVSASLKPMTHFGDQNIYFPSSKRGSLTMLRQILGALENTCTDIIFFCEHDVLYHSSHFKFTPPKKDKFYYNQNFWKLRLEDGYAFHYDANQTSALCCYKELAIEEFRKRLAKVEKEGNKSNLDFELIANDRNFGTWKSALPIIGIQHGHNLTKSLWSQNDFKNSCQGWWETDDEIPGWGKTKDLIKKFKSKMKYDVNKNKIDGWMCGDELLWLFNTAKEMDNVVEIGSWKGRSTHALLSGCKGTVYAVDHFLGSIAERETTHAEAKTRDIYQDFMRNVGSFKNLKVLKMDNAEAVKRFEDKSIDMVFIDGGHTYEEVMADIKNWLPKTKKIICGHDLGEGGVGSAVKKMFGNGFETDRGRIWIERIKKT
jgi:precorrin-6B methylase 2